MDSERIIGITLDETTVIRYSPEIEHERAAAITDLIEANQFAPKKGASIGHGPYRIHLSMADHRLWIDITTEPAKKKLRVVLPLKPFRRIIKDYFMICENYFEAIKAANPQRIEAIDMGRRGVHNEGSELLKEHLEDDILLDFDTARRLFTLICVLHIK
jgi:uncharacterized protein (UPF0262 family)